MKHLILPAALLGLVLLPVDAWACPVCFGASDGPLLRGSSMGILALLVVTLGMFGAFGAFFLHLRRRAAAFERDERVVDVAHLQGGHTR